MDRKLKVTSLVLIIISLLIYGYVMFIGNNRFTYNIGYTKCILMMLAISFFLYTNGIMRNEDKVYKMNILLYIGLFLLLLFNVTFVVGRMRTHFYDYWLAGQYEPFNMIRKQLQYGSLHSILKNIIGNCVMLIPLSFLLMLKDKKYNNILRQSIFILPLIILIEVLQGFTHAGVFDVDDIILNYLGTVIFTFLITRFDLIGKVRRFFYTDFGFKSSLKKGVYVVSLVILVTLDILILLKVSF